MNWVEDMINDYYKWLRQRTTTRLDETTGWSAISTPFLGAFNDPIEIYVRKDCDQIELSDDGVTIENLLQTGVNINRSPKRKEWLNFILKNYGVELIDNELHCVATKDNFPQMKHNMLCAMMELSDMEMMAQSTVYSLFRDDVRSFFDRMDVVYTPQFIMKGSTGIEFTFDFQIAGRKQETVIKSFNSLNKLNVPNFLFSWEDIKAVREEVSGKQVKSMAIVNDAALKIKPEYVSALESYGCDIILWSQKDSPEVAEKIRNLAT